MICIRLSGGLGNQLFQYAAGRALSIKHNCDLLLDTSALKWRTYGVTPRDFELCHFKYHAKLATRRQEFFFAFLRPFNPIVQKISNWKLYREKKLISFDNLNPLSGHIYLDGYWQKYRYFSSYMDAISRDLAHSTPLSSASSSILRKIEDVNSVAIHVRRGDYVSLSSAANFHGALSIEYYRDSIKHANAKLDKPFYFIFSDDPEWCQTHLNFEGNFVFISHNTGQDSWQDLILMSRCRHHIIANSSFSWWAARLADYRFSINRFVCAPDKWFIASNPQDIDDLIPKHWIRL